jgi:hypothetical protein
MKSRHGILVPCLLLFLVGCSASLANPVTLHPEAMRVEIGKADPGKDAQEIAPITVVHGEGCGVYGSVGTYEGAYNLLKNRAAALGADYVEIMTLQPPHTEGRCFLDAFVIQGTAYRRASRATSEPKRAVTSRQWDTTHANEIKRGAHDKTQIQQWFGDPLRVEPIKVGAGVERWTWAYAHPKVDGAIPVDVLVVDFDRAGKVCDNVYRQVKKNL